MVLKDFGGLYDSSVAIMLDFGFWKDPRMAAGF